MNVYACPKPAPRLKQPKPLKRSKRINARNKKRAAERYEENFGPKADWIRDCLVCVVSGKRGSEWNPIVAAHVLGRGAGGDSRDLVPMLASLHDELHNSGPDTFAENHPGIDLEAAADIIEQRWLQFVKDAA